MASTIDYAPPNYYTTNTVYACVECGTSVPWNQLCFCNFVVPSASAKSKEEPEVSLIDEKQVELLDGYRSARDLAHRHAQSKADRASLMRIQATALDEEAKELIRELNEGVPIARGK